MPKIFVHALEGMPDDLEAFTGKSERDIRVSWLVGNPPGSGPWTVDTGKTTPDGLVLIPSGQLPRPKYVDEVHLPCIPNGDDLARKLVSGQVHFAPTLPDPETFDSLKRNPKRVKIVTQEGLNIFYLGFNLANEPFKSNMPLRKAVVQAIDVSRHVSLGMGAARSAIGPVPPKMRGHDARLCQGPFAADRARRDLGGAGYDRTQPLTLIYNCAVSYSAKLAGAIATDLNRSLGLPVTLWGCSTWKETVATARQGNMFLYSWHQREPHADDPKDLLTALFHSKNISGTNLTSYANPKVDELLNAGTQAALRKAQAMIIDDAPMVFLSHWKRMAAYSAKVRGLRLGPGALPKDRLVNVDI